MKKMDSLLIVLLLVGTFLHAEVTKKWDFEDVPTGTLPPHWQVDATHPSKTLATWEVIEDRNAPSGKRVLALTKINTTYLFFGSTFNLCYTDAVAFKDGEISVKLHADSGRIDQGGGIMWRMQDRDNYFVARFNPLEDNFRFYILEKGARKELASADIHLKKGWHTMKIAMHGDHFEGYLDGKKLLDAKDARLPKSGRVGLWTKADAATRFDDFVVEAE